MNLPVCVREHGVPDIIEYDNWGCARITYPKPGAPLMDDWNFPRRVIFTYRARGEKIVTECGSITSRLPLTEHDGWLLAESQLEEGGGQ